MIAQGSTQPPQERSHLDFWHVSQHSNSCLVKTLTHVASSRHIGRSIVEPHTTSNQRSIAPWYYYVVSTVTRLVFNEYYEARRTNCFGLWASNSVVCIPKSKIRSKKSKFRSPKFGVQIPTYVCSPKFLV